MFVGALIRQSRSKRGGLFIAGDVTSPTTETPAPWPPALRRGVAVKPGKVTTHSVPEVLPVTRKPKPPRQRSAVSNGKLFLGRVDGRTDVARRFADIIADLEAERGGTEALGVIERQAVRAFAMLSVQRELIEAEMAAGKAVNAEVYGQLCDRMDRQSRRMGQPMKPGRKSLRDHLAGANPR